MSEPSSSRAPRPADLGEPTTLLLVRHGRTVLTEQRRFSGRGGADPGLSDAGRDDARRVSVLLAGLGREGTPLPDVGPVDAVVSSPMRRTRETARSVADATGLEPHVEPRWIEVGFGAWDGLTYAEIAAGWPDLLRQWQGSTSLAPPGGESLDDLVTRVRAARRDVVAAHPGRVVVVVTHVTPVRAAVHEALDAGPAALWRLRVTTCSVTALRFWADGGAEVLTVNATSHLNPP